MQRVVLLFALLGLPGLAVAQFTSPGERGRPAHLGGITIGQGTRFSVDEAGLVLLQPTVFDVVKGEFDVIQATPGGVRFDDVGGTAQLQVLKVSGTWTANRDTAALGMASVFNFNPTIQNVSGTARRIGPQNVFAVTHTVNLNAANITGNPSAIGLLFLPTYGQTTSGTGTATGIEAVSAGLDISAGWTVNNFVGLHMKDATNAGTFTNQVAVRIDALTTATNNLSLFSAGTSATMRHAGSVMIGTQAAYPGTAPSARLHVQEPTIGNEVFRVSSDATNDDPNYRVLQQRVATTDATVTTLQTIPITASRTYLIEARVTARRTGGVSGTADDGAAYIRRAIYRTVAGTVTLTGAVQDGLTGENPATYDATLTISGANVLVRVTGVATTDISWHTTTIIQDIGS